MFQNDTTYAFVERRIWNELKKLKNKSKLLQ